MAKIHDLFIVELAEVIKGYGNNPDDKDPFRLSEFYRFYELPNIAVSRENFEKMRPIEPERKTGKWVLLENQRQEDVDNGNYFYVCSECGKSDLHAKTQEVPFCWWCGSEMREGEQE